MTTVTLAVTRCVKQAARCLRRTESHWVAQKLASQLIKVYDSSMAERTTLSEQLRVAILDANIFRYRIAQEIDVTEGRVSRFLHQITGLFLEIIDKIGECLGLRITMAKPPRKKDR